MPADVQDQVRPMNARWQTLAWRVRMVA